MDRNWAKEVQILGVWDNGPSDACVVYRRSIDPAMTLGCRLEFTAEAADGTVEGYARDVAINLAEPIGSMMSTVRTDEYGIVWVAIPESRPTPQPPFEVIQMLEDL